MILILILSTATAALAACGGGGDDGEVTIAASTGIVADLTERVAGHRAEVVQIVPDTASPHDYQPSAEDREQLAQADLVVMNGGGLDAVIPVDDADAPVWELVEHTPDPLPFTEEEHLEEDEHAEEEGEHGREEGSVDPHVWMDPSRVAAALPELADALATADDARAAEYRRNANEAARSLRALDDEVADQLEAVPSRERHLVTSHDTLSYFADRYGFEVVATAFPATGADAEPTAAALADVIDAVDSTGAPTLFAAETDDPEALESVAEETGTTVVAELLVESPGSAGSYEEMLRRDAELFASALGR